MLTINSTVGILRLVAANALVFLPILKNTVKILLERAINGMPKHVAVRLLLAPLVSD